MSSRGRPPSYDREVAIREAARLFWRRGYNGTSTRELTSALGMSTSSLYSAFGSKAELFATAVRTYADRYSRIYESALAEPLIPDVVTSLLRGSIMEFTPDPSVHPGCMVTSAIMIDSPETLDARRLIEESSAANAAALQERFVRAINEGELTGSTSAKHLADYVQTLWQGLSAQSNRGVTRGQLLTIAEVGARVVWGELSGGADRAAGPPRHT
ncbi:TetR/AcrR family transcriptional regulator [Brevibacterium atlanticum]|uniref:TetR/AcrR family transcriptional regulator n=1 Tax=Brevibacterium atlanticum TaxID=2697563 RepID=UPI001AA178CF|nr:TetR/AcrR family transcriptional regulator [Brevibacterium atlanticum]